MARRKNNSNNVGSTRHANRNAQQDKTGRGKVKDRHDGRAQTGTERIMSDRAAAAEDYNLSWFKPTEAQESIIYSMVENDLTLVQGSAGCGKSTTVIWQALRDLKRGEFKKILFIKTPNESSDDAIGFLSGNKDDKLTAHLEASRGIFKQFMSEAKLEMEEKRMRIEFRIPNFIQGSTYDNTLFIIDESQSISPQILKLVMERAGQGSKICVLGDKRQRYSNKKRQDGFTFFVNMVTKEDEDGRYSDVETIGYVELTAKDNMRSELSKLVVALFEEEGE